MISSDFWSVQTKIIKNKTLAKYVFPSHVEGTAKQKS